MKGKALQILLLFSILTAAIKSVQSGNGDACSNPTSGGIITENQCISQGTIPQTLTNVTSASGYFGTLEYKWQISVDGSLFTDIVSSDSENFSPSQVYQTSWYRRLARVDCNIDWTDAAISNTIEITVPPGDIFLIHNGDSTLYCSIQGAELNAVEGDTIYLGAGTFIEQINITKGISLIGIDSTQTIIQSPLAADLVQSGGTWKNLKNQDVFAIIGIKTDSDAQTVIKNLRIDGFDQGYLPDAIYPNKNTYVFNGISCLSSNVIIDAVYITRVRELASDFGFTEPSYLPLDQPSGMNHNEAILAESTIGTAIRIVEIRNSYIDKFQKTGILAWGPTLEVNIHHNTIQGYGQTLWSTGNGIQIASSDRTGMGGSNGDRRGTMGLISNNSILGIGIIIPEPGQPGSYLNLGLGGSTGILLWEAGDNVQITGNTITRSPYIPSWHSSATSNDGGWSNQAIDVVSSSNCLIENNTIFGFDHGVMVETYIATPTIQAINNTIYGNMHDYWSGTGNDKIHLNGDSIVLAYYANNNGLDTISGFGIGDKMYFTDINVAGAVNGEIGGNPTIDFTGGTVGYGEGNNVEAKCLQLRNYEDYTMLYVDTDNTTGAAEDSIRLVGKYNTGNFLLDGGFISYQKAGPSLQTYPVTLLSDSSFVTVGEVITDGGETVSARGICYDVNPNPTISNDTTINGSGIGTYTSTISGLIPNTHYYYKAYAINSIDIGYGDEYDTITLCSVPLAPVVSGASPVSLDVTITTGSNPDTTQYAILDSASASYVQANGSLQAGKIWQTAAEWNTVTVIGLLGGKTYSFGIIARNLNQIETIPGPFQSGSTCLNPTSGGEIEGNQTICYNTEASELGSVTEATDYGGTLEYQWQINTTSSTFTFDDIIGAASSTYAPGTMTQTSWFRRLARVSCKDDWTGAAESNVIKVTVDPATVSGNISGNDSTIVHTSTGDLTLIGQTGEVLQWEKKQNAGSWEIIPGTATTTYSEIPVTVGTWSYRALVQSGVCSSTYTSDYMISVIPDIPDHFSLSSPGTATAGYASGNFVISLFDQYENPTYCRSNTSFNLTTNSTSGSNTFQPSSPKIMEQNTYTSTFTYTENRLGTFQITAVGVSGSTGLTGETRSANITIQILPWQKALIAASNGNTEFFPEVNAGTFKQTAQGVSAPKSDVMNFEYQQLCGNGTIIARLDDVASGGWAGVMMRESNSAGAKTVLFKTKLYNPNVWIGVRSTTNGNISNTTQVITSIHWMKIQRTSSNTFKIYTSYDGTTWIRRYTATVAMGNCINAGFFTENIVAGRTTTAWFDHAELAGYLKDTEEETVEINAPNQFEVNVYPNPANDRIWINIAENEQKVSVSLINASGILVETTEMNNTDTEYPLSHIKPGLYLLRFERNGTIVSKRLVVL